MTDRDSLPLPLLAETAVAAARAGGSVLLDLWRQDRLVEFKGEINLVTDADRRSEKTVVSLLHSQFPTHDILAEEGTRGPGLQSGYRWIIDPLDGTTNYAHRYPHFAVSVAVELDGIVIAGAVFDPVRDEMFTAQLGQGAFLNGQPIRVSETDALLHALLCTGFPYDRERFDGSLKRWDHFVRNSQAVRRDGSAALDICYVAAGRFDAFWENHLSAWDAAAAVLVVREASGTVSDFRGGAADIYRGEILASNGRLHETMIAGLSAALRVEPEERRGHSQG